MYNHNPNNISRKNFKNKTISRIKELNSLDIRLYEYYLQKFKKKINQNDTDLAIEIKYHREICELLSVKGIQILDLVWYNLQIA